MKILQLPNANDPQKFGPKRASRKQRELEKRGQLNLFSGGRILQLHPRSVFEEALIADEQGEQETAKKLYHRAIDKNEAVADAYCNLGILEFQAANVVRAIHYLTCCLEHDPRHCEAHFNLASVYGEAGNVDLAKLHYRISIEIDPQFSNSYFNLGLVLVMDKEYEQAIEVLNTYCELVVDEEQKLAMDLISKLRKMI